MRRLVPALSLAAILAACQPATPKVDVAAEEAAIRAQVTAFNTAIAAYDAAGAAAVYAPDAVVPRLYYYEASVNGICDIL